MKVKNATVAYFDEYYEYADLGPGALPEPEHPYLPYAIEVYGENGEYLEGLIGVYINVDDDVMFQILDACEEHGFPQEHVVVL